MRRLDVKEFLEHYITDVPIFPSTFPTHVDNVVIFDFIGNVTIGDGLSETQLVLITRATSMGEAEELALNARKELLKVSNKYIGDIHLMYLRPIGKHAEYSGNDENGREYFEIRFRMLLDEKEQT